VHEGIKKEYPCKSRYFIAVVLPFMKTVANRHEHAAITTSTIDKLFSHINTNDFERP